MANANTTISSPLVDASQTQAGPSRLQQELAERMLDLFRLPGVASGERLTELSLAKQLNVSRTPVRAALARLASLGVVESAPGKGFVLLKRPDGAQLFDFEKANLSEDKLIIAIARDRLSEDLPDQISETDMMRRYQVSRQVVVRVLTSLSEAGVLARKPGYGWMFELLPHDLAAYEESYRFRLLIEPSGLLESRFALDPNWVLDMRERHQQALLEPWVATASVKFFEMNAGFHEGLALASGNRFIYLAVTQQNRVRRFRNYDWTLGKERVEVSCRQHLEILERLQAGEHDVASVLMRRHIEQARLLKN